MHSGEPVPLVIAGEGVRVDKIRQFDKVSAAGGGLGFVRGREFMYLVLNYLERSKHGSASSRQAGPVFP